MQLLRNMFTTLFFLSGLLCVEPLLSAPVSVQLLKNKTTRKKIGIIGVDRSRSFSKNGDYCEVIDTIDKQQHKLGGKGVRKKVDVLLEGTGNKKVSFFESELRRKYVGNNKNTNLFNFVTFDLCLDGEATSPLFTFKRFFDKRNNVITLIICDQERVLLLESLFSIIGYNKEVYQFGSTNSVYLNAMKNHLDGTVGKGLKVVSSHHFQNFINKLIGCCNFCGQFSKKKLKKCSICKAAWYCSKECQRKDWKKHKPDCKKMKASKK